MNDSKSDGGPAFPADRVEQVQFVPGVWDPQEPLPMGTKSYPGMSLRDYFAGQILTRGFSHMADEHPGSPEAMAKYAYDVADAMLSERARG